MIELKKEKNYQIFVISGLKTGINTDSKAVRWPVHWEMTDRKDTSFD